MLMATKEKLLCKLNEVVKPYCNVDWCILKEILLCNHKEPRIFVQLKCIEHCKFELSQKANQDIGWANANLYWIDSGCAKLFAQFYNEDLTAEEIYKKILENLKNENIKNM